MVGDKAGSNDNGVAIGNEAGSGVNGVAIGNELIHS